MLALDLNNENNASNHKINIIYAKIFLTTILGSPQGTDISLKSEHKCLYDYYTFVYTYL